MEALKARKAPLKLLIRHKTTPTQETVSTTSLTENNNQGFVVVSGDTRTRAILAYADKGNLDEETLRDNPTVAGMFQEYADQIEWAQQM